MDYLAVDHYFIETLFPLFPIVIYRVEKTFYLLQYFVVIKTIVFNILIPKIRSVFSEISWHYLSFAYFPCVVPNK